MRAPVKRALLMSGLLLLVVLGVAQVVLARRPAHRRTIKGWVTVPAGFEKTHSCLPTHDYRNISIGVPVQVRDAKGITIGGTTLGAWDVVGRVPDAAALNAMPCLFGFQATELPDAPMYKIQIGTRPEFIFSSRDLKANGWFVNIHA
jgi:hypothetical protein